MSKTTKKPTIDKQQDKSDVLSLLIVIKRLFDTSQEVLNTHTQTTLMLSVILEAQMLLKKLQVMKQRWTYHLPFKEACKVKFDQWSREMERMAASLSPTEDRDISTDTIDEYCPSKHFLLDLYETLPENCSAPNYVPTYSELDVNKFIAAQNRIRKKMADNWLSLYEPRFSDYVVQTVEPRIRTDLKLLSNHDTDIFNACHDTLEELSVALAELHTQCNREFEPEQFTRLAERVTCEVEYGGKKAKESARNDVHIWKNKTPRKWQEKTLRGEIETSIKIIREMKYGRMIEEYIGEEFDIKDHFADFGQYLHKVRSDISTDELNDLLEQLYRIRYFKEVKEKQDAAQQHTPTPSSPSSTSSTVLSNTEDKRSVFLRPKLPVFFTDKLFGHPEAIVIFYDTLHRLARHIERLPMSDADKTTSRISKQWRWNHVRVACEKLGLIAEGAPKQHFADFLHEVFPFLKVPTIIKGFQRNNTLLSNFDKIVDDIKCEFDDLMEVIETRSANN